MAETRQWLNLSADSIRSSRYWFTQSSRAVTLTPLPVTTYLAHSGGRAQLTHSDRLVHPGTDRHSLTRATITTTVYIRQPGTR
jgi:hypothetical protein